MNQRNVLSGEGWLRDVVSRVANRLCEIIETGQRPSDVEDVFRYVSFGLNNRVENIGYVYGMMKREDLPSRVLEAENLLAEIAYNYRLTIGKHDQHIIDRIDAFLRDEIYEPVPQSVPQPENAVTR